jgi:hypothetical protein
MSEMSEMSEMEMSSGVDDGEMWWGKGENGEMSWR